VSWNARIRFDTASVEKWNFGLIGTGASDNAAFSIVEGSSVNGNTRLIIKEGGNVGIGTTGPSVKLHIAGDAGSIATLIPSTYILLSNTDTANDNAYFDIQSGTTGTAGLVLGSSADDDKAYVKLENSTALLVLQNSGSRVNITTSGNVGIGTTAPGALLTINSKSDTLLETFGDKSGALWTSADSSGLMVLRTGNVEIGTNVDQRVPSLALKGDADSDASAKTNETLTIALIGNATPTNAYWAFTSTQGNGYNWDKTSTLNAAVVNTTFLPDTDQGANIGANGTRFNLIWADSLDLAGNINLAGGLSFDAGLQVTAVDTIKSASGVIKWVTITIAGTTFAAVPVADTSSVRN